MYTIDPEEFYIIFSINYLLDMTIFVFMVKLVYTHLVYSVLIHGLGDNMGFNIVIIFLR